MHTIIIISIDFGGSVKRLHFDFVVNIDYLLHFRSEYKVITLYVVVMAEIVPYTLIITRGSSFYFCSPQVGVKFHLSF